MKIGSDEHRALFCRNFCDTYVEYDPSTLPWPELDDAALGRLRSIPFWYDVLRAEQRAGVIVEAYARTIRDPVIREAVDLQGREESRHARLIREMIRRYGITVEEPPPHRLSADLETEFKDFGYTECLDAFLGFGAFKIARQSQFLPEAMFSIFEMLMVEETRHIVFFINWMAWHQARAGRRWRGSLTALTYYARALARLLRMVRSGRQVNKGQNFAVTQASVFLEGFTFRRFLEDCYAENARRMAAFGSELLLPRFLPDLASVALVAFRALDRERSARQQQAS